MCTYMGVSRPSLLIESTDSMIYWPNTNTKFHVLDKADVMILLRFQRFQKHMCHLHFMLPTGSCMYIKIISSPKV